MNQWLKVKIAARQQEAADIVSFKLVDPDGHALPAFTAGAYVDVEIKPGLIRQYSLCNVPGDAHYVIAVLQEEGSCGGSIAMHQLAEGMLITISAPRNNFPLETTAKKSLLFAGGIGITPLLCMAEQLSLSHADFSMHYCARSVERMAFKTRIRQSSFANNISFHFDDGAFAQKLAPEKELAKVDASTHIYICGPVGFIDWILHIARSAGWAETQLHREYFSVTQTADTATQTAFEVQITSTGAVFLVEADQSIANALRANGVYIPTSCEQGICGTCLTNVLEGIPDHRDAFLTEDERSSNKMIMLCCSRAKSSRLILDL